MKSNHCLFLLLPVDSVIFTKENFFEQYFYAVINVCTASGLSKREIADVVNTVLFAQNAESGEDPIVGCEEISSRSQTDDTK